MRVDLWISCCLCNADRGALMQYDATQSATSAFHITQSIELQIFCSFSSLDDSLSIEQYRFDTNWSGHLILFESQRPAGRPRTTRPLSFAPTIRL